MTRHLDRLRDVARAATLLGVISAPASVIAAHQAPVRETTPTVATPSSKPATPVQATKPPTPAARPSAPSFSDLRAALARIQQRVTTRMGASAAPQTAMTSLPKPATPATAPAKPADTSAKPAEPAAKPADTPAKPAATPVTESAAKPATPAASATQIKPTQAPRIQLSWRAPLIWPKDIGGFGPSDEFPKPEAASSSNITSKRITLIWK